VRRQNSRMKIIDPPSSGRVQKKRPILESGPLPTRYTDV
jgi:hypothetical protein